VSPEAYGDKFDNGVLWAMIVLIIASFVSVIALNVAFHDDCNASDYTYCEPKASAPAEH
jgi:hypothetical protein